MRVAFMCFTYMFIYMSHSEQMTLLVHFRFANGVTTHVEYEFVSTHIQTLIRKRVDLRINKLIKTINYALHKSEHNQQNHPNNTFSPNGVYSCNQFGAFIGINLDLTRHKNHEFGISQHLQQKITNAITSKLEAWNGGRYRTVLRNEKDCYNKTRTVW